MTEDGEAERMETEYEDAEDTLSMSIETTDEESESPSMVSVRNRERNDRRDINTEWTRNNCP